MFTDEEKKLIGNMLWSTWESIGNDILECDEVASLSKEEVIETALDASYLEMYGAMACYKKEQRDYAKKLIERFRKLSYNDQVEIAKLRFTAERYS